MKNDKSHESSFALIRVIRRFSFVSERDLYRTVIRKSMQWDEEPLMMVNRFQPICVYSRSLLQ